MNIFGIGTDIVDVSRIKDKCEVQSFIERVFSSKEIEYCKTKKNAGEHFAVRFAAKESYMKAMGSGWAEGAEFREIEVVKDSLGAPSIQLHGKTQEKFDALNLKSIFVSLSHTSSNATAYIIITH